VISFQGVGSKVADREMEKCERQHLGRLMNALKKLENHCTVFTHLEGCAKETHFWGHIVTELLQITFANGLSLTGDPSELDPKFHEYLKGLDSDVLIDQLNLDAGVMTPN
jgi:hypothetical protein